ncbi:ATP-dependent RNA helicase HrpA [Thiohalophilus sp.]|uniref:ATP-dependent RNA helicase HrpA n=1 Tax=Thiohalophilus sp. TaxID=3028392 RepID=UPI002ACE6575|nr:ATP-dependent RNA helicase HrpA [Thiohalophilus sp.]MDZ7803634.1 ATP-dependent RNA helicase HrpA [Thiohalophilus sp.]
MNAPPESSTESLSEQIASCMLRDQFRFRRRLKKLRQSKRKTGDADPQWQKLVADIQASASLRAQRRVGLPKPTYPENLPVSERRDEIRAAIDQHQVVIVAGETGSGKTTQLPKICLELGRGVAGMIGHTQPRRLAARSIAERVADELQSELGATVGYKVRFKDRVGPGTYLKLMTDGILLAEIQGDRFLNDYDTLIIDEAHERSLNIDFLLGFLKQLLPKRPDLKVIITSATIDTERFSRHFDDAPVIEVSGRTYPVEVRYRPLLDESQASDDDDSDGSPKDMQQAVLDAVDELAAIDTAQGKSPGHILIFFSGEREIRQAAEALRKHHPPQTEILPLYARLSGAEQNRVFSPARHRRIVLATNVAETSLTVPGIHYVIDTGTVRISRYSYRSKIQRLPIEPVSQSSANQRKGRCGRIAEGVCIRLYSEADFNARPEFTDPEIRRTNLAAVILQMEALRLGHIEDFPFIEPPDARYIKDGYKLLYELGAVDEHQTVTALGKELARLPVDPKIGRMLIAARQFNCLQELLIIGSALSVQDPRERPADKQQQADEKHRLINSPPDDEEPDNEGPDNPINTPRHKHKKDSSKKKAPRSDFLFYLRLWELYEEKRKHLSQNKLRRFCKQHFLSYNRMQEWRDIYQQIYTLFKEQGARLNTTAAGYDDIHRALLSGLLGNIGNKSLESNEFFGARNIRFHIHPGSWQAKKPPKWIMCAELVETTRLYGRVVARIEPEWVEELAAHLLKRSYSEPHWQKKPAQVSAFERTTLYGITITPKRRVNYGPIDPVLAREIFIREALVQGDYDTRASFFKYNQSVIEEIESLEARSRRRDILVDEQALFEFYDERIPEGIYSGKAFEKWLKTVQQTNPEILYLQKESLMRHEAEHVNETQFPGAMEVDGVTLELDYHFEPGHIEDGVTVIVPLAVLGQLREASFDYLVPGLLRDKVIALIKCLPKALRKQFVPVPGYADDFLASNYDRNRPLLDNLTAHLQKISGTTIDRDVWQLDNLPEFYHMNFRVVNPDNQVLGVNRDLAQLQQELATLSEGVLAELPTSDIEKANITQWDFGDLPEVVELEQHGLTIRAYPALVDDSEDGESVSVRLFNDEAQASDAQRPGLRALFRLVARKEIKYLRKNLRHIDKSQLFYTSIGDKQSLLQDLIDAIIDEALLDDIEDIRSQEIFNHRVDEAKGELMRVSNDLCDRLYEILSQYHNAARRLQGNIPLAWFDAIQDIRQQLECLVYEGFISHTPRHWLKQLPRYLKAINLRLDKLERGALAADKQRQGEVQKHWNRVYDQIGEAPQQKLGPEWEIYRWMVEEMRVSLFAQELGTSLPVSVKKLDQQARLL